MTAAVAAIGLVVMWSSGFVGARLGTAEAPAGTLLAWRYLVAAAILLAVLMVRRPRWRRAELPRQALLGLLCQSLYLAGVVTGVGLGVQAGVAALIAVLQPLVVGALAGPVLGEPVRARQWLGLAAGLGGVGLVVAGDAAAGGPVVGYALVAGGMLALSAGTLLERRWRLATPLFDALTIHCLVSAGVFVAAAAVAGRFAPPATAGFWWAVAWVVVLSTFGGYGCYLLALRTFGATRASTLLYLTPPTTMLLALAMFGERIGWPGLVGMLTCAGSVWLVLSARGSPARRARELVR
ncbi:MAG TPA: DMT family transporter [Actinophytocola sp.]|jgi:drug/metabolite transporter (DMT)-like permease|nr:DMT family transporter [Actinophytocola sp.]